MSDEYVKVPGPQATVWLEPGIDGLQGPRLDPIDPLLGCGTAGHEARLTQHFQMLGHGGLAHREGLDELVHTAVPATELIEDAHPGRLGQDGEGGYRHPINMLHGVYACQGT
jgi:hypothetical protein